jgi:hypothetical protein
MSPLTTPEIMVSTVFFAISIPRYPTSKKRVIGVKN